MTDKPPKLSIRPQSNRREIADYINHAFETSDVVGICEAIGAATHLHNMSDIAKKSSGVD
jgi:DNA-binding phage protein